MKCAHVIKIVEEVRFHIIVRLAIYIVNGYRFNSFQTLQIGEDIRFCLHVDNVSVGLRFAG